MGCRPTDVLCGASNQHPASLIGLQPPGGSDFPDGISRLPTRAVSHEHIIFYRIYLRSLVSEVHNATYRAEDQGRGACVPEVSWIQLHADCYGTR